MGPVPVRYGYATFEEFLPEPFPMQKVAVEDMQKVATALAFQINLAQEFRVPAGLAMNPMRIRKPHLYPVPHSPLFDFERSAAGAEWIDDLAGLALRVRDQHSPDRVVMAHMDWCARNLRLGESGLLAVYDMDSLAVVPETTAVGQAAASWRLVLEDDDEIHPSLDELLTYIDQYQAARGSRFSEQEKVAAIAARLWLIAYTARCEHCGNPDGSSAIPRLRRDGALFKNILTAYV